ncbi:hypothetical protein QBC46DRAFT_288103 [Diplogelasinospora grovesii]|uniref:Uncharacterized protein n=1 Tax=Diplogelasinospora grovesii TaxID=303347 RepID=A0AAN6N7J8_9PEZI|nr:hypothetical protein QBC46DRAFT_288103 [Diplogelasinospora grovesii]
MCRGFPINHPCGHMSVKWDFCPPVRSSKNFDPQRHSEPCDKHSFSASQPSNDRCILRHCAYHKVLEQGHGRWTCCKCHGRVENIGYCENPDPKPEWYVLDPDTQEFRPGELCNHGCCRSCLAGWITGYGGQKN